MLTVSLAGVRFHAYIGLYPQESLIKNEIEIDISVSQQAIIEQLPFIDYTLLHNIIKGAIAEPTALLETIVQRIVKGVTDSYPGTGIKLAVRKLNPPMCGQVAYSEVLWES